MRKLADNLTYLNIYTTFIHTVMKLLALITSVLVFVGFSLVSMQKANAAVEAGSPAGVTVSTEAKNGTKKVKVYRKGTKLNFENRNGKSFLTAVGEDGEVEDEEELENDELDVEVETGDGEEEINVELKGNKFVFNESEASIEATSKFPLSINIATNELMVTTPKGTKIVTVLPQQAVDNMIRVGHVDVIDPTPDGEESPSPEPSESPSVSPEASGSPEASASPEVSEAPESTETETTTVTLEEENGQLIYVFSGKSKQKFLGIFTVQVPRTLKVSAEDGSLVGIQQNVLATLLDAFSY